MGIMIRSRGVCCGLLDARSWEEVRTAAASGKHGIPRMIDSCKAILAN
jgi:hypothetical protein